MDERMMRGQQTHLRTALHGGGSKLGQQNLPAAGTDDLAPRIRSPHSQRHREHPFALAQDHRDAGHFPNDDSATKLIWLALRDTPAD